MGGSVVAALASRHPALVRAGVGIDSPLITTEAARQRLMPRIEALGGPDYLSAAQQIVDSMFLPCDDPERRRRITAGMTAAPQHTMESAFRLILSQTPAALGVIAQPFLLISAGWVPFDMEAIRRVVSNLSYAQTYGSGHFSMLEVPEQVNAMIDRFLALELAES
jgi:pimeloyl-ACP methyl ester carboxylesterase